MADRYQAGRGGTCVEFELRGRPGGRSSSWGSVGASSRPQHALETEILRRCRAVRAYRGFHLSMTATITTDEFVGFFERAEPRLHRALVAAYGPVLGREATVDALEWAWRHQERVAEMENPLGYLFRVGQTTARRHFRRGVREEPRAVSDSVGPIVEHDDEVVDVDLERALADLSTQQRTAVVLAHGHGLPLREVAEIMAISVATVRQHLSRGLGRLRSTMEVLDVH